MAVVFLACASVCNTVRAPAANLYVINAAIGLQAANIPAYRSGGRALEDSLKKLLVSLGALLLALPTFGATVTINFDDLAASSLPTIANGYGGLDWSYYTAYPNMLSIGSYSTNLASAPNGAFSGFLNTTSTFSSSTPFDLLTAEMGAAWLDGQQYTVNAYRGGTLEHSATLTLNTGGAQLIAFNWYGIDQVDIIPIAATATGFPYANQGCDVGAPNCVQFTLDDLSLNEPASSPVPEPSSLVLAGTGLLGMGSTIRKRFFR
jgi:hypothetical protein